MSEPKTITLVVAPAKGELDFMGVNVNCTKTFYESEYKGKPTVYYTVNGVAYQQETNTELSFNKIFDTEENAVNFMKKFAAKNPISEMSLSRFEKEHLLHYV